MPVGKHGYLALPQPRLPARESQAHARLFWASAGLEDGARFWAQGEDGQAAAGELAHAVEAWREEKLEREQWIAAAGEREGLK